MPSCFKADFNAAGFIPLMAFLSKVDISIEPGDNLLFLFFLLTKFKTFPTFHALLLFKISHSNYTLFLRKHSCIDDIDIGKVNYFICFYEKNQIVEKYFSNSVKSLMTVEIEVIINY